MNPFFRQIRSLLRLVGVGVIMIGALEMAFYWVKCRRLDLPPEPLPLVLRSLPVLAGVGIVLTSPAWARRLARHFFDE